jgi:hypothetical protein
MKMKAKISLLAGTIALMGAVYLPQASAAVYTLPGSPLAVPGFGNIGYHVASQGAFTDWLDFSVQATSHVVGTLSSLVKQSGSALTGISLTSFELYSGSGSNPGALLGTATIFGSSPGSYFANLDSATLNGSQAYTLKVVGFAESANASYSGGINVLAVPEPDEWAMMLVGVGLVGYQVRRKQAKLAALMI